MLFLLRWALVLATIVLWIWCAFDVVRSDGEKVRYLHKLVWLIIVVFASPIGSFAWLLLGRPETIGSKLKLQERPPQRAPDDSPDFLRRVDDEIRRRRRADKLRKPPPEGSAEATDKDVDEEISRLENEFKQKPGEDTPPD